MHTNPRKCLALMNILPECCHTLLDVIKIIRYCAVYHYVSRTTHQVISLSHSPQSLLHSHTHTHPHTHRAQIKRQDSSNQIFQSSRDGFLTAGLDYVSIHFKCEEAASFTQKHQNTKQQQQQRNKKQHQGDHLSSVLHWYSCSQEVRGGKSPQVISTTYLCAHKCSSEFELASVRVCARLCVCVRACVCACMCVVCVVCVCVVRDSLVECFHDLWLFLHKKCPPYPPLPSLTWADGLVQYTVRSLRVPTWFIFVRVMPFLSSKADVLPVPAAGGQKQTTSLTQSPEVEVVQLEASHCRRIGCTGIERAEFNVHSHGLTPFQKQL